MALNKEETAEIPLHTRGYIVLFEKHPGISSPIEWIISGSQMDKDHWVTITLETYPLFDT